MIDSIIYVLTSSVKYKKSLNQKGKGYNDIEQNLYLYLE
jgi:hypothetical protein